MVKQEAVVSSHFMSSLYLRDPTALSCLGMPRVHDETSSWIVGDEKTLRRLKGRYFDTQRQSITQDTNRGYTITVMGTSGSLSHSVTITVNVTA